jgi:hypothetical protein
MLRIQNELYFQKVVDFAAQTGRLEKLFEKLLYLHRYADPELKGDCEVDLRKDFAPASFSLVWHFRKGPMAGAIMEGGLLFHGTHDAWGSGSGPTYAVCATPTDGWSVHT